VTNKGGTVDIQLVSRVASEDSYILSAVPGVLYLHLYWTRLRLVYMPFWSLIYSGKM